jgi:hypothetical protein
MKLLKWLRLGWFEANGTGEKSLKLGKRPDHPGVFLQEVCRSA